MVQKKPCKNKFSEIFKNIHPLETYKNSFFETSLLYYLPSILKKLCLFVSLLCLFESRIADQTNEIKNKLPKLKQSRTSQQTRSVLQ